MPVKATLCGLPGALSVTLREAVGENATVGAKVTEIVQLAPAARLAPQVSVSANWCGFGPVREMRVILSVVLPIFVSVTWCTELMVPTA